MLRWALVGLLVANAGFYAWSQGALDGAGSGREPARLQRQVNPQSVRVLRPPVAGPALGAASAPTAMAGGLAVPAGMRLACLEAGPLDMDAAALVEAALREVQLPPSRWRSAEVVRPGLWIVYMGRFAEPEELERKRAELERRQVTFQPVQGLPELEPGFQLGRYDSAEAAQAALAAFVERGVRTARIVTVTSPQRQPVLRLPDLDPATAAALPNSPAGRFFRACAEATPAG